MKVILAALFFIAHASAYEVCKLHLYSPQSEKYYNYFPLTQDYLEFNIKSTENAHILLSSTEDYNQAPTYEFVLNHDGNHVTILRRDGVEVASYYGPVLDSNTFRYFKITIDKWKGTIELTTNVKDVLISYKDPYFVPVSKVGVSSFNLVSAEFHFPCNQFSCHSCLK